MGVEAIDRRKAEPLRDGLALSLVGNELDALAVANPVDSQRVSEAVDHASLPSESSVGATASIPLQSSLSALAVCSSAAVSIAALR